MYRLIAPNIRGGICQSSVRYAKANNKYMGRLYNPNKQSSYILYIDANNLYGWAQSQPLPKSNFEMLDEGELREAQRALTSDDLRTRLQFFDMARRFRALLHQMINALDN